MMDAVVTGYDLPDPPGGVASAHVLNLRTHVAHVEVVALQVRLHAHADLDRLDARLRAASTEALGEVTREVLGSDAGDHHPRPRLSHPPGGLDGQEAGREVPD